MLSQLRYLQFVLPSLLALLLLFSFRRRGRDRAGKLTFGCALALTVFMFPPFGWLLHLPLEYPYWPRQGEPPSVDAIVVLSGFIDGETPDRPYPFAHESTMRRVRHAAWVYRRTGRPPILVCGPSLNDSAAAGWELMAESLRAWGVDGDRIWGESRGSSTYEQALYGARILEDRDVRRIALVTDAWHMLRAAGSFRAQGLQVIPEACGYVSRPQPPYTIGLFIPGADTAADNEAAVREYAAVAAYWLQGKF